MASTTPARKVIKTSQLPSTFSSTPIDPTVASQNGQEATLYTVAMTAINFVAFLLSLVAVDVHYTIRRYASGSAVPAIMPRWLHAILRPNEPYENYYQTKQKKLMRMEAEDAFKLRNRTLAVMALSLVGSLVMAWYVVGRAWQMVSRAVV